MIEYKKILLFCEVMILLPKYINHPPPTEKIRYRYKYNTSNQGGTSTVKDSCALLVNILESLEKRDSRS